MELHTRRLPERSNLILTACLLFLTVSLSGCEKPNSATDLVQIRGQVISDDEDLSLVPDAQVVLVAENGASSPLEVKSTANASGEYALTFDKSQLPDHFLLQAEAAGHVPYDVDVNKQTLTDEVDIDILLQPLQDNVAVLQPVSSLHHLGDNLFNGAPNSQFQKTVEGRSFEMAFTVTNEQLTATSAVLQVMVKGCEVDNPVFVDLVWIGYLNNCSSNGSFALAELNMPLGLLSDTHSLRIESTTNEQFDFDNFEFGNILIEFRYEL